MRDELLIFLDKNAIALRLSSEKDSFIFDTELSPSQQKNLEILGRKHSAKEAISAIESASNLFDRYSFDLIYAIPEQNLAQWKQEVEFALSLVGGHISLYQLTIEKGTPFYHF